MRRRIPVGKRYAQYLEKNKTGVRMIEVQMIVRLDGTKRPVCTACDHSVTSHGEKNGEVFCWACVAAGNKQCPLKQPAQGHCVR